MGGFDERGIYFQFSTGMGAKPKHLKDEEQIFHIGLSQAGSAASGLKLATFCLLDGPSVTPSSNKTSRSLVRFADATYH